MAPDDPNHNNVSAGITELQNLLLATSGVEDFLNEVVVLAARTVAAGLSCGITLQTNGHPVTVASSDIRASLVDELQYEVDEGPCLRSMGTGKQIVVADTTGPDRWGGFSARAAANGIRSILTLPLAADGILGALNIYAPTPDAFGEAETRQAEIFAASASAALALASRQASATDLTRQLREALASRTVIDQAIGIIMAQERCASAQAFAILRNASQNRNVKLRDIASQIVTGVSGEPPCPGPFSG
jgi:GAF domain-containing protein